MHVSTRSEYGCRAMLELSRNYGQGRLSADAISTRQEIPERYLEQILLALRRAGFIHSRRGPGGGYVLVRPPNEIFVADVIRTLDGHLAPVPCASETAYQPCPREENCGLHWLWVQVRNDLANRLENTSFELLLAKEEEKTNRTENA
ncbi:Rrf2 family transcriptional regulator [bacterium]|nr:Rrf2 family transcriptional regulator [bacterium]